MILFEMMTDEKNIKQAADWFKQMDVEEELQETKRKIQRRKPMCLWQFAMSAAVIVLMIAGISLYQIYSSKNNTLVTVHNQDIMPGSNVARLTLNNGEKIPLNNSGADTNISDKIKVLRKDEQLVYNNDSFTESLVYNTLTVPRKGQYKLVLPDGSRVWLNAESSTVAFVGNERKVFVTGETFFEVAKDKAKPFRVVKNPAANKCIANRLA